MTIILRKRLPCMPHIYGQSMICWPMAFGSAGVYMVRLGARVNFKGLSVYRMGNRR